MAKLSDTEVYNRIRDFEEFKAKAAPLLELIPEIKEKQDAMMTANAVAEATEQQKMDGAASRAVAKLQKSWSWRLRQIAIIGSALVVIIGAISNSFGEDASKLDYKALAEAIKEIGK